MCFFIRSFSMVPVAFWYIGVFVSTLFYPVQRNINKKVQGQVLKMQVERRKRMCTLASLGSHARCVFLMLKNYKYFLYLAILRAIVPFLGW